MPKVVKAPKRPQQEPAWGLELQLHWENVGHSLNQLDNNNIFMKIQKVMKYVQWGGPKNEIWFSPPHMVG